MLSTKLRWKLNINVYRVVSILWERNFRRHSEQIYMWLSETWLNFNKCSCLTLYFYRWWVWRFTWMGMLCILSGLILMLELGCWLHWTPCILENRPKDKEIRSWWKCQQREQTVLYEKWKRKVLYIVPMWINTFIQRNRSNYNELLH